MSSSENLLLRWTGTGTSPVDWCEKNYTVSPHIAEFVNTISNVVFLLVPAIYCNLWSSYARNVSRGLQGIWIFFIIIGLSSAYFHATLSLLGQLLDEVSILWTWMFIYTQIHPKISGSDILHKNQQHPKRFLILLTVFVTVLGFVQPAINAFVPFILVVPTLTTLLKVIWTSKDPRVIRLGVTSLVTLFSAFISWVCDRFLCGIWEALNFTLLHGVWHVLIFFSSYNIMTLFLYLHAFQCAPESMPVMRYWPRRFWGLPFVFCKSDHQEKTP